MFFPLVVLFALIPLLELLILIRVGVVVGAGPTILVVILTAFLGAYLAKREGFRTLAKIRDSLRMGAMPAEEIFDAFLILVAGILLLTPGFLTDTVGFVLLIPPGRKAFKRWLKGRLGQWVGRGGFYYRRH